MTAPADRLHSAVVTMEWAAEPGSDADGIAEAAALASVAGEVAFALREDLRPLLVACLDSRPGILTDGLGGPLSALLAPLCALLGVDPTTPEGSR